MMLSRWLAALNRDGGDGSSERVRYVAALVVFAVLMVGSAALSGRGIERALASLAVAEHATGQHAAFEHASSAVRDYIHYATEPDTPANLVDDLHRSLLLAHARLHEQAHALVDEVARLPKATSGRSDLVVAVGAEPGTIQPKLATLLDALAGVAGIVPGALAWDNDAVVRVEFATVGSSAMRQDVRRVAELARTAARQELARTAKLNTILIVCLLSALAFEARWLYGHFTVRLTAARHDASVSRAELDYVATHDTATGSWNKARLRAEADALLQAGARSRLIVIHLAGLRTVDHQAVQQEILCLALHRIRELLGDATPLGRIDVDSFAIIRRTRHAEADRLVAQLLERFAAPFEVGGERRAVDLRIGWASAPEDGDCFTSLLAAAELAVGEAKRDPTVQARSFEPKFRARVREAERLRQAFRAAIDGHELELHYQPKLWLADGALAGFEALIRWRHPVQGLKSPGQFLWAIEGNALEHTLAEYVVDHAIRQVQAWRGEGLVPEHVAVNLGAATFASDATIASLLARLDRASLPAGTLQVEVTERVAQLDEGKPVYEAIDELRARGVRIALDDFGTGYASLTHLAKLPVDIVKLDRSFVQDVHEQSTKAAVTAHTLAMLHDLGKVVVAEGIETAAERDWLRERRCEIGQGYLLGMPLPVQATTRLLRQTGHGQAPLFTSARIEAT